MKDGYLSGLTFSKLSGFILEVLEEIQLMFIFVEGQHSYEVQWKGQTFKVRCQQETGRQFEAGVQALAEIAYNKVTGKYMPTAGMIEYYTAQRMGVEIDQPEMDWSGDVDY